MNGKQARMLRRMLADKSEKRAWKKLPAEFKGALRRVHDTSTKLVYSGFWQTLGEVVRKR